MSTRPRAAGTPTRSSAKSTLKSAVRTVPAAEASPPAQPASRPSTRRVDRSTATPPPRGSKKAAPVRPKAAAAAPSAARPRATKRGRLDLVLLGASGYTGRQAMRAVLNQCPQARWAVAGRDAARLQALLRSMVPAGAAQPEVIVADTRDPASLLALARRTRVLFNLAGPYHATGDAVVQACIDAGTHYLDLSAETFWIQRLVRERHEAARRAGVKIIPCAGYEALPFDLATLWAASQLRAHAGEPCASVKIVVRVTGRLTRPQDLLSGGTAATVTELLAHDHTDCVHDMACLLPPQDADAPAVAQRNAVSWLPRYDDELGMVLAPTLPGPFVNPPVVLRGVALQHDASLFTDDFRYREGTDIASLLPGGAMLPKRLSLALQWAAAAALAAPLAHLGATLGGPLQFQRPLIAPLLKRVAPKPGTGPREQALDAIGYELEVYARGSRGARFHGRVVAQGHPGYRSTPEMAVCAALGLADGSLGRTPFTGIVSPAAGLGLEAVAAMERAGLRFVPLA